MENHFLFLIQVTQTSKMQSVFLERRIENVYLNIANMNMEILKEMRRSISDTFGICSTRSEIQKQNKASLDQK